MLHTRELNLLGLLIITFLTACEQVNITEQASQPPALDASCRANGMFAARLFGGISVDVEWSSETLRCKSMARIIALPDLRPGQSGKEFASNVTVTIEGSGRFFSSPNMESCWTDVVSEKQPATDEDRYTLTGMLYCVSPLGELNGDSAVSVAELSFASIVNWSNK